MYLFRRGLTAALFILSLASLSAQDVEIVVTATKEPTPAETLPVEVVVLDGDALKDKATVAEALETVAVRLTSQVPGQYNLTAPGFGENAAGRILLLLDGFSQNSPDMNGSLPLEQIPVFALERIEVLRGPGSSVYGTGALAGAVNLITRTPTRFEAETSTTVESNLTNRLSLAAGLPVAAGGLILSVQRSQDLPSRDRSDSDNLQAWGKFSYPVVQGDQETKWELWGAFKKGSSELPGGLGAADFSARPDKAANPDDSTMLTESKGGALYSFADTGWKVSAPVSVTSRSTRFQTTSWGSYSDQGLLLFGFDPRLTVSLGQVAGADWEWMGSVGAQGVRLLFDKYTNSMFATVSTESLLYRWSGFVVNRLEAAWGSSVFAEASVRAEFSRTTAASQQDPQVNGEKDFSPLSGDLGVAWLPSPEVKLGVQLSRVFRYPYTDEMVSYQGFSPGFLNDIEAELGHSVTFSSAYTAKALKVSLSGTALRMENEVIFDGTRNVNAGPTFHGISLATAEWTPFGGTVLGGEYAYELALSAAGAHQGKSLPIVPGHFGRLWGRWSWNKILSAEAGWKLGSDYYTSGDFDNTAPTVPVGQHLDASVIVRFGETGASLRVFGKNLTDDRSAQYVNSYITGGDTTTDTFVYYPTAGRTFGATLGWKL